MDICIFLDCLLLVLNTLGCLTFLMSLVIAYWLCGKEISKKVQNMTKVLEAFKRKSHRPCDFPPDILVMILTKVGPVEFIRAGAVCNSWRAATLHIKDHKLYHPSFQLPWLMHSLDAPVNFFRFLNLSNTRVYKLSLQRQKVSFPKCLGCFGRWLVIVDCRCCKFFLINPFSRAWIPLPHEAEVVNTENRSRSCFSSLWSNGPASLEKAVLSSEPGSNDCIVAVAYDGKSLAFCKVGDEKWIVLEEFHFPFPSIFDILYSAGCFYVLREHAITVLKLDSDLKFSGHSHDIQLPPHVDWTSARCSYLVESCDDLLIVLEFPHPQTQAKFCIFKMDRRDGIWVQVRSLGDQMLFLSRGYSTSVSSQGLSTFEANSIHFPNYMTESFLVSVPSMWLNPFSMI